MSFVSHTEGEDDTGRQEDGDLDDTEQVIKEFLFKKDPIFSVKLQKLCYYADLYCVERWGKRLLNVEYKAYMYGAYSEEIHDVLHRVSEEDPAIFTVPAKRRGKLTKKFGSEEKGESLPPAKRIIIDWACTETEGMDTDDLTKFSKKNAAYERTPTGDVIDFEAYRKALLENRVEGTLWEIKEGDQEVEEADDEMPDEFSVEDLASLP